MEYYMICVDFVIVPLFQLFDIFGFNDVTHWNWVNNNVNYREYRKYVTSSWLRDEQRVPPHPQLGPVIIIHNKDDHQINFMLLGGGRCVPRVPPISTNAVILILLPPTFFCSKWTAQVVTWKNVFSRCYSWNKIPNSFYQKKEKEKTTTTNCCYPHQFRSLKVSSYCRPNFFRFHTILEDLAKLYSPLPQVRGLPPSPTRRILDPHPQNEVSCTWTFWPWIRKIVEVRKLHTFLYISLASNETNSNKRPIYTWRFANKSQKSRKQSQIQVLNCEMLNCLPLSVCCV